MIIEISLHDDTHIKFSETSTGVLIEFRQWNARIMSHDEMKIHLDVEMKELAELIDILIFFKTH
jgi:hypothetical protein